MTEKWTNGHCCCRSGVQDVYSHSLALTEEFNSHELLCVAVVQHFWTQTFHVFTCGCFCSSDECCLLFGRHVVAVIIKSHTKRLFKWSSVSIIGRAVVGVFEEGAVGI